ncbi:Hsp20/alpha crystallin family protein [Desulfoferrobacter suflitae]|uniref:Hsp20/alpha crystallin family protein n=1 Tax=Desulfoferrobacter suflitae TaxID=2865782 RepID=UPI0021644852|nr:Hsp20/alpha crystallin family protein [Desulfoferrobacter suflitae]MCK8602923.1 Hsp20/alpha crystallin family protein [Desulfoferrobacter suflitae]
MELVPWKSFGEVSTLRKEMDNLLNKFFGKSSLAEAFGDEWAPSLDVSETANSIVVKAELPGLEVKDIDVSLAGDLLTIKGEKRKEEEEKGEHYHYSERYYGSFRRSFRLPTTIQADKIEAKFDKGVLRITLPKTEEAKQKEIKIKVE